MDVLHVRFLKHNDDHLPASERRVEMDAIEPEDLREFQPVRRYLDDATADALAAGGTLDHTHIWSAWDKAKWCAAFLLIGLALGAVAVAIVNHLRPLFR